MTYEEGRQNIGKMVRWDHKGVSRPFIGARLVEARKKVGVIRGLHGGEENEVPWANLRLWTSKNVEEAERVASRASDGSPRPQEPATNGHGKPRPAPAPAPTLFVIVDQANARVWADGEWQGDTEGAAHYLLREDCPEDELTLHADLRLLRGATGLGTNVQAMTENDALEFLTRPRPQPKPAPDAAGIDALLKRVQAAQERLAQAEERFRRRRKEEEEYIAERTAEDQKAIDKARQALAVEEQQLAPLRTLLKQVMG